MQDNSRAYSGEELQNNQNADPRFSSGNDSNNKQQMGQPHPKQEGQSTFEPSEIDQQEGNMNHGTLGGNFEEDIDRG